MVHVGIVYNTFCSVSRNSLSSVTVMCSLLLPYLCIFIKINIISVNTWTVQFQTVWSCTSRYFGSSGYKKKKNNNNNNSSIVQFPQGFPPNQLRTEWHKYTARFFHQCLKWWQQISNFAIFEGNILSNNGLWNLKFYCVSNLYMYFSNGGEKKCMRFEVTFSFNYNFKLLSPSCG